MCIRDRFTAGSIAFLKMLQRNKRYYYKTNHFISISGMIYRMKQNAASLSLICIMSTGVLLLISCLLYTSYQDSPFLGLAVNDFCPEKRRSGSGG